MSKNGWQAGGRVIACRMDYGQDGCGAEELNPQTIFTS
jgi:hypothetical protein